MIRLVKKHYFRPLVIPFIVVIKCVCSPREEQLMPQWPLSQDYNEAIQQPAISFHDPELRQGEAVVNALGLPMPRSGNFADVCEFITPAPRRKWAVKCFTRPIPGLGERYREVSAFLKQMSLPFMVDFQYLEQGMRIHGDWYPIVKMHWVEGFTLNEFVRNQLGKPALLDVLCQIWVRLAQRLRDARIGHCDLQHGNVLLVPGSKAASLAVKLVDYDGMCVPALTLLKSIELGHPNFQHPQRLRDSIYSLEVDRFSHLAIYTALRSVAVAGPALWDRYDNGDNLLFKQADFEQPANSAVFQELLLLQDPLARRLAAQLAASCAEPLDRVPLLTDLLEERKPPAVVVSTAITAAPGSGAPVRVPSPDWNFDPEPDQQSTVARTRRRGVPAAALIAASILVLIAVSGTVAWMVVRRTHPSDEKPVAQEARRPTKGPARAKAVKPPPVDPVKPADVEDAPPRPIAAVKPLDPPERPQQPGPFIPPTWAKVTLDPKEVAEARRDIRERHRAEFAKVDPNSRGQLGWRLAMEAGQARDDPIRAFALGSEAQDIYLAMKDIGGLMRVSQPLALATGRSIAGTKGELLEKVFQVDKRWASRPIVYEGPHLIDIALADDDYETASRLVDLTRRAAEASGNAPLQDAMAKETERLDRLAREYSQIQPAVAALRGDADNPDANLRVGKFYGGLKGDWELALPLLARSSEQPLRDLAKRDLDTTDDGATLLALAVAWRDHASRAAEPLRTGCLYRAYAVFEEARLCLEAARRHEADDQLRALIEKIPDAGDWRRKLNMAGCALTPDGVSIRRWTATRQFYHGPVDITVVGRTGGLNFRMAAFDGGRVIFNWEGKPGLLILDRPNRVDPVYHDYAGEIARSFCTRDWPLQPNIWYTIRWRLTERSIKLWVNGELIADDDQPNVLTPRRPIRFGVNGQPNEIKSLAVRRAR
jgi:hypothetical protein